MFSEEFYDIVFRSTWISGSAVLLALMWSTLLAYYATKKEFLAKHVIPLFEALIGVPTVLIGLLLYMLLSSKGVLGFLNMLYTPQAIIIGQAILVTPLITSTMYRVFNVAMNTYGELALSLGASEQQTLMIILKESMPGFIASAVMGFSRAIGELGIALIVGGNIRSYTRVLTTAIALEISKGEFEEALILGGILVSIVIITSFSLRLLRKVYGL